MNYSGWAFKPNEKELSKEISDRYKELMQTVKYKISKSPQYGKTSFILEVTEGDISEMDALIIADDGNVCFGGYCTKQAGKFYGAYFID
jgi:hypothetical protein